MEIGQARELAQRWSAIFGHVPEGLVLTIMGIESSFHPDTENHTERAEKGGGAWGIMQVLQTTAADLIPKMQKRAYVGTVVPLVMQTIRKWDGTGKSLLDPELGTAVGAYYLDRLWQEFHDFNLVVAAYQSGPAKVRALVSQGFSGSDIAEGLGPHGAQYVVMANAMRDRLKEGEA